MKIPFIGGFYEDRSKNLNAQRCVNLYPVQSSESGKGDMALYPTPGSFLEIASNDANASYGFNGPLITDSISLMTVAHQDIATASQANYYFRQVRTNTISNTLVVTDYGSANGVYLYSLTNGSPGTDTLGNIFNWDLTQSTDDAVVLITPLNRNNEAIRANFAYVFNKGAPTTNGLAHWENSSIGYPTSIAYMDGYFIINDNLGYLSGLNKGKFFVSNIAPTYDTIWWSETSFASFYYRSDNLLKLITSSGYLYLFGKNHYEVWYNSGDPTFPFAPIREATQEIGLAHAQSIVKFGNLIAFIGQKENSGWGVYLINGLEIKKISTPAIDKKIKDYLFKVNNFFNITDLKNYYNKSKNGSYAYEEEGHAFISFTLGDEIQIVYDLTTNLWHERSTIYGITDRNGISYSGKNYVINNFGDLLSTNADSSMFFIRWHPSTMGNIIMERYRISPHMSGEDNYLFHKRVRADIEFPTNISYDSNANFYPYIELSHSDDDAKTWKSDGVKNFSNIAYGNISGDKRVEWFRLGRSDDRLYKVWTNANIPFYLSGLVADVDKGYR